MYKINPCERLSTTGHDDYQIEQVDEVFQEEELPFSFDIDPAPPLDSLGGDLNDIILPQKKKREPKRKKDTRPLSRRKQIDSHDN